MSRSGFPRAIIVDLARPGETERAVIGSDAIFYPDGRWSRETTVLAIRDRFRHYTEKGWRILGWQPCSSQELPLNPL